MGSSQVPQKRDNLVSDLDTQLEIRIAFFFLLSLSARQKYEGVQQG